MIHWALLSKNDPNHIPISKSDSEAHVITIQPMILLKLIECYYMLLWFFYSSQVPMSDIRRPKGVESLPYFLIRHICKS